MRELLGGHLTEVQGQPTTVLCGCLFLVPANTTEWQMQDISGVNLPNLFMDSSLSHSLFC